MRATIKKMIHAAALSIAGWTILSVIGSGFLNRGTVVLWNPFGMNYSNVNADGHVSSLVPIFTTSLIFYALFGIALALVPLIFKNEKWSLLKATLISYGLSVLAFVLAYMTTYIPYGAPDGQLLEFWYLSYTFNLGASLMWPILLTSLAYAFVWVFALIYFRHETRQLNIKIEKGRD